MICSFFNVFSILISCNKSNFQLFDAGMITGRKEKCCYIIRNNFVMIRFHQAALRIQQTNILLLQESDIYFVELDRVPENLNHLFNSVHHIYKYLKNCPECIIQMTEQYLKFVVEANGNSVMCCLDLKLLQLQNNSLVLKKKGYEICVKSEEFKNLKQKSSNQLRELNTKLQKNKQVRQIQRQNLKQMLQKQKLLINQLQNKKAQCIELQQSLRQKQDILMSIKMKQGAFVALDD